MSNVFVPIQENFVPEGHRCDLNKIKTSVTFNGSYIQENQFLFCFEQKNVLETLECKEIIE